jgi:hypothetical protein
MEMEISESMPDFSGSYRRSDSWTSDGSPSDLVKSAVRALQPLTKQVQAQTGNSVELSLGSRFGFRMLGFLTPKRLMPLRLIVRVTAETAQSTRVMVDARSDEGRFLFEIAKPLARRYNEVFDDLFARLRKATVPMALP